MVDCTYLVVIGYLTMPPLLYSFSDRDAALNSAAASAEHGVGVTVYESEAFSNGWRREIFVARPVQIF